LAIAVATLWVASVGDAADARLSTSMLDDMDTLLPTARRASKRARAHMIGCFRRGVLRIIACLIATGSLPASCFVPEPWPKTLDMFPYPIHRQSSHQKAA
jgi:hypothetical protein